MTTADAQDRLYDLHAGLTPNQRAVLFVEHVRRSRNSTQLFQKERSGPLRNSAMARACTNLYGGVGQSEDGYDAAGRTRSQDQVRRDVVTLVRMIRLVNAGLESSLHEIGMRAAAVVRMLQTTALRTEKDGLSGNSGFTRYVDYEAFLEEAGRIRASLWQLLKHVFTEQAVVEALSEKYFFGKPILFREKERHLARTLRWLLAAIGEYNALVSQKFDSGESSDKCAVESESNSEVTDTVSSLDPDEVRAAVSPDECKPHVQLVETAALCQGLVATGDGAAAMDILADLQRERPTHMLPC